MDDQLPTLTVPEIEVLLERTRHEAGARHDLIGLVHHLFEVYRLDRREKNPHEHATRIVLADRFIPAVVTRYKTPTAS